ncbi:MAG: NUDIX domain-containing protein, partial [Candidatus Kapabacteria bacterium]|nr:NUDIX domain-containing protein [Candidatus Kapabacteria bacterium]
MEQSQSPAQPTRKHVVVAVMARRFDSGFEVLLCRRKKDDRYGLMWEFPGGKVEEGETAFEAVERECTEELGIMILDAHLVRHESADYADGGSFRVEFYVVFE